MKYEVSPKVTVPLAAGAIVTVLAWLIVETTGTELPPEVAAAVTTIVMAAVGYLKRDPRRDI